MWKSKSERQVQLINQQIDLLMKMRQEGMMTTAQMNEAVDLWNKAKLEYKTLDPIVEKVADPVPETNTEEKPEVR